MSSAGRTTGRVPDNTSNATDRDSSDGARGPLICIEPVTRCATFTIEPMVSTESATRPGATNNRMLTSGPTTATRRRLLGLTGAVLAAVGLLWLAVPRSPDDASPEAGYVRDILRHDATMLDAISMLDVESLDEQTAKVFDGVDGTLRSQDERARTLLGDWGLDPATDRLPMEWMGHLLPGATPGALEAGDDLKLLTAEGTDPAVDLMRQLSGHLKGAVLMSRGILGLAESDDALRFAEAVVAERNELLATVEAWFVERGELPPTWIAPMTTDPGKLDHGDPVSGISQVAANALRWLPFTLGVAVIIMATAPSLRPRSALAGIAGVASGLAGLVHLAVAGVHADDAAINGVFFVVAGLAQVIGGTLCAARPSPRLLNAVATLAGALVIVYAAFRILPPPGSIGPADIDLAGLVLIGLQLAVVAMWALRPLDGPLSSWGADILVDIGVRGVSAGILVVLAGFAGTVGYAIGEADSRPPSETDVGFTQDMIAHHDQAVRMAQLVAGRLSDPTIEQIAREVVIFQRYEIGVFDSRLREWGQNRGDSSSTMQWMGMTMPIEEMPGVASQAQLSLLRSAEGEELDEVFLTLLAVHHVGGVQMAAFAAENADDGAIAELAGVISRNQRLEINEFRVVMDQLGYQEAAGSLQMSELANIARLTEYP